MASSPMSRGEDAGVPEIVLEPPGECLMQHRVAISDLLVLFAGGILDVHEVQYRVRFVGEKASEGSSPAVRC